VAYLSTLAVAGVCAAVVMGGVRMAADARAAAPAAVSCEQLRKLVDGWEARKAVPNSEIRVTGEVQHIEENGSVRHLSLCEPPDPVLLCIAAAAEERQVGDVLILSGIPSLREHDFVVFEQCIHQVP
jgi:hypothetical protein